jgi:hypothetical protein
MHVGPWVYVRLNLHFTKSKTSTVAKVFASNWISSKKKHSRNMIVTKGPYIESQFASSSGGKVKVKRHQNNFQQLIDQPKPVQVQRVNEPRMPFGRIFNKLSPVQFGGLLQIWKNQAWPAAVPLSNLRAAIQPGYSKVRNRRQAGLSRMRSKDACL